MDDLDRLMDQPASTPAASDPIDAAMDGYMQQQTGAVRAGASLAIDSNPDEVARQKRVAKVLNVPMAAVEADPAFAIREQKMRDVEAATEKSPTLRAKFTDADFAKLAHDNLDSLSGIEQLIRSVKRGFTAGLRGENAVNVDLSARGLNALDRGQGQNEPLRPRANLTTTDAATLEGIRSQYGSMLSDSAAKFKERTGKLEQLAPTGATAGFYQAEGWGDAFGALFNDPFEIAGNVAIESLGLMAPAMPGIVAGGMVAGPAGLAAGAGLTSSNMEYSTAIAEALQQSGVDLADAAAVKAYVATPEFAEVRRQAEIKANVIGAFDAATAGVAGVALRPTMAGNLAAQTVVQMAGGAAGEAAGSAASGQEISASAVLAEAIGEVPGAFVDVSTVAAKRVIESRSKVAAAEEDAAFIEQLNQAAAADKLLARDPETFQQFIAAAAEDGPVSNVYLDGRMLMQSGMAPRLAELSPAVVQQLDRAILTGGMIAIPVDEYMAKVAPTEIAPQLLDHLKTDPEGFTRAEAQEYMANAANDLEAEVGRALADRQVSDEFKASQAAVKQQLLDRMNEIGRFSPQKNEVDATLIAARTAVRAAQLGMTPEAMFQKQLLSLQGEAVTGQQLDQTRDVTETPEFRRLSDLLGSASVAGDMLSVGNQSLVDGLNADAKELTYLLEGVPRGAHVGGDRGVPASVVSKMLDVVSHDDEILGAIVRAVPVDVMNLLTGEEVSPEDFLRNKAMLEDVFSVSGKPDVSLAVNEAAFTLADVVARTATELASLAGRALESNAAVSASAKDSIFGDHVASSSNGFGDYNISDPNILHQSTSGYLRALGIQAGATSVQKAAYIADVQWTESSTDPATGFPVWKSQHVELAEPRDVTETHDIFYRPLGNERAVKYDINNPQGKKVGHVVLELDGSWPLTLLDIEVAKNEQRNRIAERTVAAITQDVGELGIWTIVPGARSWWERIGTRPVDEHNGTIAFDDYADARADRENAGGLAQSVANRRTDLATRASIDAMSPEEMRVALEHLRAERRTSKLAGIPNLIAFEEDASIGWPAVGAADMDGLGFYNDVLGHLPTDALIKAVGDILTRHTTDSVRFYHRSGDEFAARGASQQEVDAALAAAQADLAKAVVVVETPLEDGSRAKVRITGLGLTYGVNQTYEDADAAAIAAKEDRTAAGQRAPKGTNPGGIEVLDRAGARSLGERGATKAEAAERLRRQTQALYQSAKDDKAARAVGALEDVRKQWEAAGIENFVSEKNGVISLSQIVVAKGERGTGKGTAAMQALVDYADRSGQRIVLTPSSDFGGNKKRLVSFYKRFGFVENKGKNKDFTTMESMYREPSKPLPSASSNRGATFNQAAWSKNGAIALNALAAKGDNKAIVAKSLVDNTPAGSAENLGDVLVGVSLAPESDRLGSFPSLGPVLSKMRGAILVDPKVLDAVVGSVPVDMVNDLFGSESAAKVALHDEAMLKDGLAFNADVPVSGALGDAPNPVGLLVREAAFKAAETVRVAFGARMESGEGGTAVGAGNRNSFNHGERSPRATFSPSTNTISLLRGADLTSVLHETGHYFFENDIALAGELVAKADRTAGEQQILDDVSALLTWHGIKGDINEQLRTWYNMDFEEQRSHHERTAESFEAYLFEGRAPSIELAPYFQKFRAWLTSVYRGLKEFIAGHPEAGTLNDEVRAVFDRMLATDEQIALAEQGRSMMPLFEKPEHGMTPEAFAEYQALGADSTAAAIESLQAKGLRDMQWLKNSRSKVLRRLQKEAAAKRAEAQIEARREVMSRPVYRAWDFLTRKLGQEDKLPPLERKSDPAILDPTIDSLFVAIAKLGGVKKEQVVSEWGVDPKDTPQSGLFAKPVWRLTDGLTLDGMAEALAQHGYLPLNEHGQYELNDLADRFIEELGGNTQYSDAYQYQDLRPGEQIANPAGLGAGRLDVAGIAEIGVPIEMAQRLAELKMTAADGLHPDLVAQMFDFSSGDEMLRALATSPKPGEAIDALTDKMMVERNAELSSPEALERAADAAIHNEVRARMLATEANALSQAVGQRKILTAAAREYAANLIAAQRIRDIRPVEYASAAAKAGKLAEKASRSGDLKTAAAEKRNQVIQTYATRAAYDAQDEVEKALRYLKRFDKEGTRKSIDADYLDQVDAILERFDLRKASNKAIDRRKSLAQWLAAQREAGVEPDIPGALENEANRKNYKEMTVEEFRGMVDTVQQIVHLGRLKNKLLTAQDQRAFAAIVKEAGESIVEHGGKARPVELETPTGIKPWLEGFAAGHRKFASLLRQMDGGVDNGPLWRILGRSMNEAATSEAVMIEQATVRLAEIYQPMLAKKGGLTGSSSKLFIPEINDSLTRGGRLAVALNWGNETNRLRVMEGDGWSERQVHAVLKTLTRDEWQFVQDAWSFIDSYWPQIEAKEKRVTGRAPDKVQASPFTYLVDGETISLTGGYYPIKYDSNRSERAEQLEAGQIADEMKRGAFSRSTTRRGHTKARTESVKRPVRKSLDVITQHVSEVTHDLAWHEWLIDANRILAAKPVNQAIRDHYGPEVMRTMKDALTGIATADIVPQTKADQLLMYLRANVSRSTMGWSLTTAFLQPFGLAQSMVRIGPKHVMRGMARWVGDAARFESSLTWINDKSDFMRLRAKTFNRELHEIKGRVSSGKSQARVIYDASLFMLMQKMQLIADVPTWIGAYEKAIDAGHDEATAVALADQSVLDAQGGGQTKDMAEFQRKHPFMAMFYSYFNTTLNLAAESTAKTDFRNPLALAGWASDMALLMVIPALAPAMLMALMRGEECGDAAECSKKLAEAQASYLLGTLMYVREASGIVSGYDYSGPPAGRVVQELSRTGKQVAQGEADEALATSTISLLGVALGIPTTQILRSYRGWKAWEDGDASGASLLLGPPKQD